MKRIVFLSVFLLVFVYTMGFAADFEDRLILPDFTDDRFVLLNDSRISLNYCDGDESKPVFVERYVELNPDGSWKNMIVAFFKSNINDYPFIISMWKSNGPLFSGVVYLDAEEDGIFEIVAKMGAPEAENIVCRYYSTDKVKK